MAQDFRKQFLETRTQLDLVNIIVSQNNSKQYGLEELSGYGVTRSSPPATLINFILTAPGLDSYANDYNDYVGAIMLSKDINFLRNRLGLMGQEYLIAIILNPSNAGFFPGVRAQALQMANREQLTEMILKVPGVFIDNNMIADYRHLYQGQAFDRLYAVRASDPNYNTGRWVPKPYQVDHINRLYSGLMDPNTPRCVMDASPTGKGKTIVTVLNLIALKVKYVLVFCPKRVMPKWDDALRSLGLFEFRLCNYSGILGNTRSRETKRWARYRPDPVGYPDDIRDMNWLQIVNTYEHGKYEQKFDWSFLPDEEAGTGLGGCAVIWDEAQNVKGKKSKVGVAFEQFIDYIKKEKRKFIRSFLLTGTAMEKIEDLPYMLYALGYIALRTPSMQTKFIRDDLLPNFQAYLGSAYKDEYQQLVPNAKLILFIRHVAGRQNRFSQIPDSISFLLAKLGFIKTAQVEETNAYTKSVIVPNFKAMMGNDWTAEQESLKDKEKLLAYLRHIAKDPKYPGKEILAIIDYIFENPIIFQGIKIEPADMELFVAINRELEEVLMDMIEHQNQKGMLGRVQKTMSQLETLKLTPFTRFGRKVLETPLPGGSKGSLVISVLRNQSARYFAWRFEAIMTVDHIKSLNLTLDQLNTMKTDLIQAILSEYASYNQTEQYARQANAKLQIKSTFNQEEYQTLMNMSFEDLWFEFTKWHKYLDIKKFEYVCIFVGDFGSPNPSNFDLQSSDEEDWVKESAKMKDETGLDMLDLFQKNKRRVFITNMQIAREGIDLHDISIGGMNPRGVIVSPGIIARYFLQMIGRFVREGQTSNSLRIAGFIESIPGVVSWEKKFMERLSEKVKYIQALHEGEVSLDILENIDVSGETILREVLNEMKRERTYAQTSNLTGVEQPIFEEQANQLSGPVEGFLQRTFAKKPHQMVQQPTHPSQFNATFIQPEQVPTFEPSSNPAQPNHPGQINQMNAVTTVQNKLIIRTNDKFLIFDVTQLVDNGGFHDLFFDLVSAITNTLSANKIDKRYYAELNLSGAKGVIVYRAGIELIGLDMEQLIKSVVASFEWEKRLQGSLQIERQEHKPGELDNLGFNPTLKIPVMNVVFESATSILVTPKYPVSTLFPLALLGSSLQGSSVDNLTIRLAGTTPRIILSYYAVKAIAVLQYPEIYERFLPIDNNGVLPTLDKRFRIATYTRDGAYFIFSDREMVSNLPIVLGVVQSAVTDLAENRVFENYTVEENDMASVTVAPKYQAMITKLLGREPEKRE